MGWSAADLFLYDGGGQNEGGEHVAMLGDVDGDGVDDLLVQSPRGLIAPQSGTGTNGYGSGQVHLLSGAGLAGGPPLDLADGPWVFVGPDSPDYVDAFHAGHSIGSAGDMDDDGLIDFIVGVPDDDPSGQDSGAAYIVFSAF